MTKHYDKTIELNGLKYLVDFTTYESNEVEIDSCMMWVNDELEEVQPPKEMYSYIQTYYTAINAPIDTDIYGNTYK